MQRTQPLMQSVASHQEATIMDFRNRYTVQALFKDNLEWLTVIVAAEDPVEAETIVRRQSMRELLICGVIRVPIRR